MLRPFYLQPIICIYRPTRSFNVNLYLIENWVEAAGIASLAILGNVFEVLSDLQRCGGGMYEVNDKRSMVRVDDRMDGVAA